jgi:hippurate hydrolase
MDLAALIAELQPRIAALRRDIHAHPELAFKENRTSDTVAAELAALGVTVHRGLAGTGIVGVLKCGDSDRAIGLRADMDALPLQESNSFAHRSVHAGCMHACGHDGHIAMLVGAAAALARTRSFDGTVHFIFQPAEEHEGGGRVMVEQGLFERFPMQMVFGLHNWPGIDAGSMAIIEGPVMAATDRFEILIDGRGGHAAMPHLAVDTIMAGSALVQALQSLVSREADPLEPAVVSVTRFHAGGDADNILPERAVLGGTVRSFRPEMQEMLEAGMRRVCDGIAATYRVAVTLNFERGYPATINAEEPSRISREVARQVVAENGGGEVLTGLKPSMGAEDFAYLARVVPGCYAWLGNGPGTGGCMLHSPHYDFNDNIIATGIRYWVRLVEHTLPQISQI